MAETRILSLASGRGSNFQAVVRAIQGGRIPEGRAVGLIVDRQGTGAADFAAANDIPVSIVDYRSFPSRAEFDRAFAAAVDSHRPDLILALGYMRIIHSDLVERYQTRILNIHPSLLPAFPGMNAQKQAHEYGVKVTGATVHYLDSGVDTGPIVIQAAVTLPEGIAADALADRILDEEHRIIVEAVGLHCAGRLRVEGRRVRILSGSGDSV